MTRLFVSRRRRRACLRRGAGRCPLHKRQPPPTPLSSRRLARIHERVIALDTHDDINVADFTPERNYTQDLGNQVNLPKMMAGGLDAAFFIVYVGQGPLTPEGYDNAYKQAIAKFDAIHLLTEKIAPDKIELALTAADVRRISKAGKKVALIGVENGYPLGDASTAIKRVKEFHARGARYLSLAHNGHSQLADSNNGEATGSGAQWPERSRQAGHCRTEPGRHHGRPLASVQAGQPAGDRALEGAGDRVALGARALCDHSRDLDDELLLAIKKNGGVAQAVAFASLCQDAASADRRAAGRPVKARNEFGLPAGSLGRGGRGGRGRGATAGARRGGARELAEVEDAGERSRSCPTTSAPKHEQRLDEINEQFPPPPRANVKDFVDHIDYITKKIGIDHVGISSDFDGGGGIDGWNDASETFNVTLELVRRGYTEDQIAKIWSGNLLRVMEQVRQVAVSCRSNGRTRFRVRGSGSGSEREKLSDPRRVADELQACQ